ncbi:polysaccharide pyruvyl transferase family protein [Rhodosalinus sp. K401]|uniref:polysaccharide pyruvyl transferase family protein n=1 Tax=Rhodosalinus sp. K401 TaxID=3239195 RepID=UPI0035253ACB
MDTHSITARIDDTLDEALGRCAPHPYALLDFPAHSNIGDSAIWLGTLAKLRKRLGSFPAYVSRNKAFPTHLDQVMPEGPLLLLGGGNFGDLWPGFWENRVAILDRFPHRKIVQLPQSIHFSCSESLPLKETRRAIARHSDFTMMVRDTASLDFARENFDCPVYLCPDMAFALGPLHTDTRPEVPVLALMRDDQERHASRSQETTARDSVRVTDWIEPYNLPWAGKIAERLARSAPLPSRTLMAWLERAYRLKAEKELRRGIDLLAQGHRVVTDRLHGHILCSLMGKTHVVLDNHYGKVFNYINTWAGDHPPFMAKSFTEALRAVQEFN